MKLWVVALLAALALSAVAVLLRLLELETVGQLLWFLAIVVFLWCAVQISLLLRPRSREGSAALSGSDDPPLSRIERKPRNLLERFFPGASLSSGKYNRRNKKVWDGNENLPNYRDD